MTTSMGLRSLAATSTLESTSHPGYLPSKARTTCEYSGPVRRRSTTGFHMGWWAPVHLPSHFQSICNPNHHSTPNPASRPPLVPTSNNLPPHPQSTCNPVFNPPPISPPANLKSRLQSTSNPNSNKVSAAAEINEWVECGTGRGRQQRALSVRIALQTSGNQRRASGQHGRLIFLPFLRNTHVCDGRFASHLTMVNGRRFGGRSRTVANEASGDINYKWFRAN